MNDWEWRHRTLHFVMIFI